MSEKKEKKNWLETALLCLGFFWLLVAFLILIRNEAPSVLTLSFLYIVSILPKEGMLLAIIALLRNYGFLFVVSFTTLLSVLLDAFISLLVIFQFNTVIKIKFVSKLLEKFNFKWRFSSECKLFLFLFHLVPLMGFGPFVTSILGKILKIDSTTVFYIVISGTAITSLIFSILFYYGISMLPQEYVYILAILVIVLPLVFTAFRLVFQSKSSPPM